MSGRAALKDALDSHAQRHIERHQVIRRANVTSLSPLTVDVFGYDIPLTLDNDFDLSQWMVLYQQAVGLDVGDMVLMHQEDKDWVLVDVISETDMPGELGGSGGGGARGPQGPQGVQGPAGPPGVAGTMGLTGPAGPKGDTGAIGPTGPSGGPAGPKGDTGATGPAGPTGAAGPIGPTGPAGATGPPGADGIGTGNVDGGEPDSVYGATPLVDGGGV